MQSSANRIAIEGKGIVKDFRIGDTTTKVLKGVSLKVLQGEFVSIMGQSGSAHCFISSVGWILPLEALFI